MINHNKTKHIRRSRACDVCRRKKKKCDGPEKSLNGLKCSFCEEHLISCTYDEPSNRPSKAHVNELQKRIEELESELGYRSNGNKNNNDNDDDDNDNDNGNDNDDEILDENSINEKMKELLVTNVGERYLGDSSHYSFFTDVTSYTINDDDPNLYKRELFWQKPKEFNKFHETPSQLLPNDIPPSTQLYYLTDIYFKRIHPIMPLLNKEKFMKNLEHLDLSSRFSGILLLVLALASKFGDTLPPNETWLTAGETYFNTFKTKCNKHTILSTPTIEDVQTLVLLQMYCQSSPDSIASFNISAYSVILSQDLGLNFDKNECDDDIKRLLTCQFIIDRSLSVIYGRSCVFKDEDIMVELSTISNNNDSIELKFLLEMFKIHKIIGDVLHVVYNFRKAKKSNLHKVLLDVAKLNSDLNQWNENLHPDLKYDPNCKDNILLNMMKQLRVTYHVVQIYLYRKFLRHSKSTFRFTALIICTNAARSIIRLFENMDDLMFTNKLIEASPFLATMILIITSCEARNNVDTCLTQELDYIKIGLAIHKRKEHRDIICGRRHDALLHLIHNCSLNIDEDNPKTTETIETIESESVPQESIIKFEPPNEFDFQHLQNTSIPPSNGFQPSVFGLLNSNDIFDDVFGNNNNNNNNNNNYTHDYFDNYSLGFNIFDQIDNNWN